MITDYHIKYYANELRRRCPSDSIEKLTSTLMDAQVDLNPHQVEAALFAFRSPLSMGAILADEVGLGKTIEAGLVISQKWAERKRNIPAINSAHTVRRSIFMVLYTKSYKRSCARKSTHTRSPSALRASTLPHASTGAVQHLPCSTLARAVS